MADISTAGLLTAGSFAAIVAAGWSQVKALMFRASSLLIVHTTLPSQASRMIFQEIRANWKFIGDGNLRTILMWIPYESYGHAPGLYFDEGKTSIWRKGSKFLLIKSQGNSCRILSIRGNLDVRGFIRQCTVNHLVWMREEDKLNTRFGVHDIRGADEKEYMSLGRVSPASGMNTGSEVGSKSGEHSEDISPWAYFARENCFNLPSYLLTNMSSRPEGLFQSAVGEAALKDAQTWLNMKSWYQEANIPWKRGFLFGGLPGSGKSSLAMSIAQTLKFPIYRFFLSTLSDHEFVQKWGEMDLPAIVLLEDIDNVFDKRTPTSPKIRLSFDCLLNQISGIQSNGGIFVIVTTNDVTKIDPAMGIDPNGERSSRPGRIDRVFVLNYADDKQKQQLVKHILSRWPHQAQETFDKLKGEELTVVQVQDACIQRAFELVNEAYLS